MPIGPAWSYEVKWDDYRCLALKVGDDVTLRSRNASNLTASYPAVAAALRTLKAHRALLDDEIVAPPVAADFGLHRSARPARGFRRL